ncbi:hypothetical protein ACIGQE_21700 [Streptomyces sp. NPDC053429]|uniref:hypothetical protein n=1 Tax=Streptomyces sp. NPDC053429 TaxID=3365702 RepID=UPI0037D69CAA
METRGSSRTGDPALTHDRDLKFRGYEVFRFGHDELRDRNRAQPLLADFFATLLDRSPTGPSHVPLEVQG